MIPFLICSCNILGGIFSFIVKVPLFTSVVAIVKSAMSASLDYSVSALLAFSIVVLVLAVFSIVLRFWSRLVSPRTSVGYDVARSKGCRLETDSMIAWTIG